MSQRRDPDPIVITGMGAVSPLGAGPAVSFNGAGVLADTEAPGWPSTGPVHPAATPVSASRPASRASRGLLLDKASRNCPRSFATADDSSSTIPARHGTGLDQRRMGSSSKYTTPGLGV